MKFTSKVGKKGHINEQSTKMILTQTAPTVAKRKEL